MEIDWKKKTLRFNDGTMVCFGIKRKRIWFKNENEVKYTADLVSYVETKNECLKQVIQDHKDFEKDMQEYIQYLQKKCGDEVGSFCEIVKKDGTKIKLIRYVKDGKTTHKIIKFNQGENNGN